MSYTMVKDERYNRLQIANAVNVAKRHCRITNVRWKRISLPSGDALVWWTPSSAFWQFAYARHAMGQPLRTL